MATNNAIEQLRKQLQRYRIMTVEMAFEVFEPVHRHRAMEILQRNMTFQLFVSSSGDQCVCLRRRQLPSATAVAGCLASQSFCNSDKAKRTLLTSDDIQQYFPTLFRRGLPKGYYVDATNKTPVLGLLRVDTNLTPVNRIWRRSLKLFEKHNQDPSFRDVILRQQFQIAWAVPTESKARAINTIVTHRHRPHLELFAEYVPMLLDQLVSLPNTFPDVVGL
jgi:hypothetical protein